MGRHSNSSEDETDIIAEVVDEPERSWIEFNNGLRGQDHRRVTGRHFEPMFRGMHDTDEHMVIDHTQVPPVVVDDEPSAKRSQVLLVAFAMAVGIVIGGLVMAVAAFVHQPTCASTRPVPVTITKTVPPPTVSETP